MINKTQSSKSVLGSARHRESSCRSSGDSDARPKFWEMSGGSSSGGGGLFSLSASLLPGSESDGRGSPASPPPSRQQRRRQQQRGSGEWTAGERARRVAGDPCLRRLLAAECESAGVVTAAGYRAVHQRFLYSEVVGMEMERSQRGGRRKIAPNLSGSSSRFGSLFSSIGSGADRPRRPGDDLDPADARVLSSGSDLTDAAALQSNIAPRRTSQADITSSMRVKLQREAQEHRDRERGKLNMDSFFADLDRKEGDDEGDEGQEDDECRSGSVEDEGDDDDDSVRSPFPRDSFLSAANEARPAWRLPLGRQDSERSLDLQDIFDGMAGSRLVVSSPGEDDVYPSKAPSARQSSGFTATCTTLSSRSRHDVSTGCFNEVDFDPDGDEGEDGGDRGRLRSSRRSHGSHDSCGWLPWPGQDDVEGEEGDGDDDSDARRGELIESFLSMSTSVYDGQYDERDSFRPWPRAA